MRKRVRKPVNQAVHPFMEQCGLPARVEGNELLKRSVAERLAMRACRGGISDERNIGKPPLSPLREKTRGKKK